MASASCSSSFVPRPELLFCCPNRHFNLSMERKMLDFFTSPPSFHNHLCAPRIGLLLNGKTPHRLHVKLKSSASGWKAYNQISRKWTSEEWSTEKRKIHLVKAAIATVEREVLTPVDNGKRSLSLPFGSNSHTHGLHSLENDSADLEEKEKLRRMRISKANKGNVPWNKGRRHSPETLQRIRERTRIAMQDPKVKMKLQNLGHAQSEETKIKIGAGVREGWQRRREMLMVQDSCLFAWQNIIAEASRKGYASEDEVQWDSYKTIDEQLKQEWLESVQRRRTMPRPKGSKRAPKSPEQRRKISEAISAKWADPEYRGRVFSALSKCHGVSVGSGERKRRRKPPGETSSVKRERVKVKSEKPKRSDNEAISIKKVISRRKRNATPSYKDPMASTKLEMVRKIRAERAAMENKKKEATERAKLLIAEAEKAAKALEVAALKSPLAQASLIETRKLIAEATRSIESIESGQLTSNNSEDKTSFSFDSPVSHFQSTHESDKSETNLDERIVNGSHVEQFIVLPSTSKEDEVVHSQPSPSLEPDSIQDLQVGPPKINGFTKHGNFASEKAETSVSKEAEKTVSAIKAKKWVCGRLVEVDELF